MNISILKNKFKEDGYFVIEKGFSLIQIDSMKKRLDDIIAGKFNLQNRRFQVDSSSSRYEDINSEDMTYRGPNKAYRKVSDLEFDEVFLEALQSNWVREICMNFIGETVSIMRLTMMNKPPEGGTFLPWHQDISIDWPTNRQPSFSMWFPLDDATSESGTLQIIPGSHKHGMINNGHLLPDESTEKFAPDEKITEVEIKAGNCLFFHPAVLHRSGINKTSKPRRAINAILMEGNAIHTKRNIPYPILFGDGQITKEIVSGLSRVPK